MARVGGHLGAAAVAFVERGDEGNPRFPAPIWSCGAPRDAERLFGWALKSAGEAASDQPRWLRVNGRPPAATAPSEPGRRLESDGMRVAVWIPGGKPGLRTSGLGIAWEHEPRMELDLEPLAVLADALLAVTRRSRAEAEIRANEERTANLLRNLPGYAYRCFNDPDWTLEFISEGVEKVTGYSLREFLIDRTITCAEKIVPEDRDRVFAEVQEQLERGVTFESTYRIETKDHEIRWLWERGQRTTSAGATEQKIEGFVTDITALKRSEEALAESQRRLAGITDAMPGVVYQYRVDARGKASFPFMSGGAQELFGVSPEAAVRDAGLVFGKVYPADVLGLEESARRARETGGGWNFEFRVRRPHDDVRWVRAHAVPEPVQPDGSITWNGILTDVTEQKNLEQQVDATRHLTAVGTLAAGVAHEINNPLTYIYGNVEFSVEAIDAAGDQPLRAAESADLREALVEALEGVSRIRSIVADLRKFSRMDHEQEGTVDLIQVLALAQRMCANELKHQAQVVEDYAELRPVVGNQSRLTQVFINLIHNALAAMPDRDTSENEIRLVARMEDDLVSVEVQDNGAGIPLQALPHIFDPFFTTKMVGSGLGLGLSVCHGIVTAHRGRIQVDSRVGRGTTFRVVLPAAPVVLQAEEPPSIPASSRRARILVVDDEKLVLSSVRRILATEHDVVTAASAPEALELIGRGPDFDLVLCDLMMPGMTGMELHRRVTVEFPRLEAHMLFLTGGTFTAAAAAFADQLPDRLLEKPIRPARLREVVRHHVHRRS